MEFSYKVIFLNFEELNSLMTYSMAKYASDRTV